MKLSSSNEILAESKVLILYILNNVTRPISENNLLKIVVTCSGMNYFYFQQFLLDLLKDQYIEKCQDDDLILYIITDSGKKILELTNHILPGILKLKLDTCIKEFKNAINRNEFSIVADFTPEGKDNFFVDCKIVENNKIIFSIRIFAGSREQAKIICDNWKHNAQTLYPQFLELLRGK